MNHQKVAHSRDVAIYHGIDPSGPDAWEEIGSLLVEARLPRVGVLALRELQDELHRARLIELGGDQ